MRLYGWDTPAVWRDDDPSAATHSSTARMVAHVDMIAASHFLRNSVNMPLSCLKQSIE